MTKRQPPNWIIRPRSSHGALDDTQVQSLAKEFMLPEPEVRKLSKTLAHPLSERFAVRGILKVIKQMEKGPSELEKLIKELRHAELRLRRAAALYSEIHVRFPAVERGTGDPNPFYKAQLDQALSNIEIINSSLARRYTARFTGDPDKRQRRDERRGAVLRAIFDTWDAAGRKVSISTIGSSSERSGPLVDFANAVVRCVTDPATEISGETIWSEIKEWRGCRP